MKITVKMTVLLMLLWGGTFAFAGGQQENGASGGKIVLDVMAYGDNSNQEGINWKRMVSSFEQENPNITINYELLYDEAYHQKVTARLAAGQVPDLAYMGADARWGAPWKEAGQQWDHSASLDPIFDPALIPAHGPNGEIYEIPVGTSNITTVMFMNKALVEELGFSAPRTYEDLAAMVPAAKAAGMEVVTIDGADGWAWGSCVLSSLIARSSGEADWVSKAVAGQYKFTDKAFVDALNYIKMMVDDGIISEKSVMVDYGSNISRYNNKQALFMIQGQWAAGGIENAEVREATEFMAFPRMPGEKSSQAGTVAAAPSVGYGITQTGASDKARLAAALKFLKYINSEAESTQRLRDGGIIAPVLADYKVPEDLAPITKKKVLFALNVPGTTQVIDSYLTGAPNEKLIAGVQQMVTGQISPEALAEEIEALARK